MGFVKAFIGGLIGAAIAMVVLLILRGGSPLGYQWFPIVTGLLTGLGTRLLAGSGGRSLATGIVAAVISLIVILAGDDLVYFVKMYNFDAKRAENIAQLEAAWTERSKAVADELEGSRKTEDAETSDDATEKPDDSEDGDDAAADDAADERASAERSTTEVDLNAGADSGLTPRPKPQTLKDFLPYI